MSIIPRCVASRRRRLCGSSHIDHCDTGTVVGMVGFEPTHRQCLQRLPYRLATSLYSLSQYPLVVVQLDRLHTGLEPLLRRHHTASIRLDGQQRTITRDISRNFSALRRCIGRIRSLCICRSQPLKYLNLLSPLHTLHLMKRKARLYISFQTVEPYDGAADGNRTRVASLEGWCSAIELQRQNVPGADTAHPRRVARLSELPLEQEGGIHAAGPLLPA